MRKLLGESTLAACSSPGPHRLQTLACFECTAVAGVTQIGTTSPSPTHRRLTPWLQLPSCRSCCPVVSNCSFCPAAWKSVDIVPWNPRHPKHQSTVSTGLRPAPSAWMVAPALSRPPLRGPQVSR